MLFRSRRLAFTLLDLGLQPQRLLGLRHLPRVLREAAHFRALLRQQPSLLDADLRWAPIFGDLTSLAGSSRSLYFLQDLLCSAFVLHQPAGSHLDIGSRVDGFVAQVAAMDHVVTVSSTAAHIAGALGKPATVLLPAARGLKWHWMVERPDSPWYPSLTLLRQSEPGRWTDVIETCAARLAERRVHP